MSVLGMDVVVRKKRFTLKRTSMQVFFQLERVYCFTSGLSIKDTTSLGLVRRSNTKSEPRAEGRYLAYGTTTLLIGKET